MKKKVFFVALTAIVMVSSVKFVETSNLKNSDAFGAANVYGDNKSLVNIASDHNVAESKWFGELATLVAAAITINQEVLVVAATSSLTSTEYKMNNNQNIAMTNLD